MDEPRPGDRDRGHLHIGVLEEIEERHRVVGPAVRVYDDESGLITGPDRVRSRLRAAPAGGEQAGRGQKSHESVSKRAHQEQLSNRR
jgi:hypothetical protein